MIFVLKVASDLNFVWSDIFNFLLAVVIRFSCSREVGLKVAD
jgi:hypothetical protein